MLSSERWSPERRSRSPQFHASAETSIALVLADSCGAQAGSRAAAGRPRGDQSEAEALDAGEHRWRMDGGERPTRPPHIVAACSLPERASTRKGPRADALGGRQRMALVRRRSTTTTNPDGSRSSNTSMPHTLRRLVAGGPASAQRKSLALEKPATSSRAWLLIEETMCRGRRGGGLVRDPPRCSARLRRALWAGASVAGVPEPRSSNHRSKEWLREAFRIDPPRGPREALRRFVISFAVVMAFWIGTSLLFEVLGWPTRYAVVVGSGLGFPIAAWYLDRRRGSSSRGTRREN